MLGIPIPSLSLGPGDLGIAICDDQVGLVSGDRSIEVAFHAKAWTPKVSGIRQGKARRGKVNGAVWTDKALVTEDSGKMAVS